MALESLPKIAPALFSAEQDLLEIYNKKSDTRGTINPSYIKSSPSGVSGAIQFSDGSAFASDGANLFWDNTNKRLGIGTTTPTFNVEIYGGASTLGVTGAVNQEKSIQIARYNSNNPSGHYIGDDGGAFFGSGLTISSSGSNSQIYLQVASSGRNVNIGTATSVTPNMGARLGVRGSGSTSATSSLLVQNSSGTNLLEVKDNGNLLLGTTASGLGKLLVSHDSSYGDRVFLSIQNGFDLLSTRSNALLLINGSVFYGGTLNLTGANYGVTGQIAAQTNNSSIQLTTSVNAYNGTNQDDACNLLYIKNNGVTLQAGGSVNFLKLDGTVNEAGGGGVKFCTGIYYNPTLTGGALLANSHYCYHATSGQMMVNTTSPQSSAQLQVDSTTRGFLPPRVTTIQKNAIVTPANGLMVFDTDLGRPCFYNGAWVTL